ncbi:hypothetical protein TNCV_492451 [Trichonephila clavipes]|nr:hypothetical protein TNCV_492451 [Trichonephila clavipes]
MMGNRLHQPGDVDDLAGQWSRFGHQKYQADEAWLYDYDPTLKQQSSEWRHPSSPSLKKAKSVKSAGKVMTIIFIL